MKKIVSILAVAIATVSLVSAKGLSVGVHGYASEGWGAAYANGSTPERPFGANLSFGGGAFVNSGLKGPWNLQAEVNYYNNNVGDKSSANVGGNSTTTVTKYTYSSIDIPVLLGYKYKSINFLVGPYISIPVSQLTSSYTKTTIALGTTTNSSGGPTVVSDISGVTFGATAGFDYETRLGPGRAIVGVRYLHDFSPVKYDAKDDDGNVNSTKTYFYRGGLELTLGFKVSI